VDYIKRQKKLLKSIESRSLDALLVRKKQNISYLTGTKGDDAVLFVSSSKMVLITDARYKEEYAKSIKNCRLSIFKGSDIYTCINELSKKTRSKRIGFESDNFSYSGYISLKKKLKDIAFVPVKGLVESFRVIKDSDEVSCIREACRYGSKVINFGMRIVRPSISELTVKKKIEQFMGAREIEKADFDIIVASGKNASMPHASSSKKNIRKGDMVVIDLGAVSYGYNSDLTRTVFLGKIERKFSRIYNIVLDAQKRAIENIRPGVSIRYIDNISRQYISRKGFGRYFIHNLGHGIGLEVHEMPNMSKNNNALLEQNMTLTIEPGIYIPGWGGVRLEDVVLVTKDGCEVLT